MSREIKTNRDLLIATLTGELDEVIDDSGAMSESVIFYNLSCPYYNASDGECGNDDDLVGDYDTCARCKMEWLDKEIEQ